MKNMECPSCRCTFDSSCIFCSQCGDSLTRLEAVCNLCGLSCRITASDGEDCGNHGLIEQRVSGGYHSTAGNGYGALDDGTTYKFSLCEFCLDWVFSQCQIAPELGSYMSSGDKPESFVPAAVRVRDEEWRSSKKEFFAERDRRDAARAAKRC